jgi:hypothetical protein
MDNATMVWHIIIVLAKTGCPMLVKLEYPGQKREKRKRSKEQPCRFRPVFVPFSHLSSGSNVKIGTEWSRIFILIIFIHSWLLQH